LRAISSHFLKFLGEVVSELEREKQSCGETIQYLTKYFAKITLDRNWHRMITMLGHPTSVTLDVE